MVCKCCWMSRTAGKWLWRSMHNTLYGISPSYPNVGKYMLPYHSIICSSCSKSVIRWIRFRDLIRCHYSIEIFISIFGWCFSFIVFRYLYLNYSLTLGEKKGSTSLGITLWKRSLCLEMNSMLQIRLLIGQFGEPFCFWPITCLSRDS